MYVIATILCIIIIVLIAKFDKKKCIKLNKEEFVIEKPDGYWVEWISYYKGRINIYKILIVCALIPFVNYFLLFISTVIIVLFTLYYIINKVTNKLF